MLTADKILASNFKKNCPFFKIHQALPCKTRVKPKHRRTLTRRNTSKISEMFKFNFNETSEASGANAGSQDSEVKEAPAEKCLVHQFHTQKDGSENFRNYTKIFLDDDAEDLNDVILNVELTDEQCNHDWDKNHTDLIPVVLTNFELHLTNV